MDHPDCVLALDEIAPAVADAVARLSQEERLRENKPDDMSLETSYAAFDADVIEHAPPGAPSPFSCPSCGGVLWEVDDDELLRFRCRVGHAYTADAAFDDQSEMVDAALWAALRALLERAHLARRVSKRSRARGSETTGRRFEALEREALEQAELIRSVLLERNGADG